ncbi:MAG TPA: ABC transporter ATP-binding protein [Candidatus Sulfomarinibacteraceae bacterium]|nr:ABC transporter ATP-binding protein [Candidatus Sulfomarinibacteraceae bacterium]
MTNGTKARSDAGPAAVGVPPGTELIRLTDVTKVFNSGRPNEFTAVDGVSLTVEAGRVTGLVGPSGSGKTTLASLIGCMARPTSGRIRLDLAIEGGPADGAAFSGGDVSSLPERFLTQIRRRTFGFIFQQFHLVKGLTVLDNVMLPAYPEGEPHHELRDRAVRLLATFGLGAKATSKVEWLSGGEAQRVAIARALINDPSVVIADEPTAHLDTALSRELIAILGDLRAAGRTVIVASHDPLVTDSGLLDRVVRLRDGRVEPPEPFHP